MSTSIIEVVEHQASDIIAKASAIVVSNDEQRIAAGNFIKDIKDMQSEVSKTFDPIVEKAHAAHKEAVTQRAKFLDPLKEAEKNVKKKAVDWDVEQENIRLREQARLVAEAKAAEELQRKSLEAEAEKLIDKGEVKKAEALIDASEHVEVKAKIAYPTAVKVKGQSIKENWSAEVVNLMDVAREVVAGRAPISYLMANMPVLNQEARVKKDAFVCKGVKVNCEKTLSSTGRTL